MILCLKCGVTTNQKDNFCINCGFSLNNQIEGNSISDNYTNYNSFPETEDNSFYVNKSLKFPTYIKQFKVLDGNYDELYYAENEMSPIPILFTKIYITLSILFLFSLFFIIQLPPVIVALLGIIPLILLWLLYNISLFFLRKIFNFNDYSFFNLNTGSTENLIGVLKLAKKNNWQILDDRNNILFSIQMKGSGLKRKIKISSTFGDEFNNQASTDQNSLIFLNSAGEKAFNILKKRKRSTFTNIINYSDIKNEHLFIIGVLFDLKFWNSFLIVHNNEEGIELQEKKKIERNRIKKQTRSSNGTSVERFIIRRESISNSDIKLFNKQNQLLFESKQIFDYKYILILIIPFFGLVLGITNIIAMIPLVFILFVGGIVLFFAMVSKARTWEIYTQNKVIIGKIKSNMNSSSWKFIDTHGNTPIQIFFKDKNGKILSPDNEFTFEGKSGSGFYENVMFVVKNDFSGRKFILDYANVQTKEFDIEIEGKIDLATIFVFHVVIVSKFFVYVADGGSG